MHLKGGHQTQGSNADLETVEVLRETEVKDVNETPQGEHLESERENLRWNPENSQWVRARSTEGAGNSRKVGRDSEKVSVANIKARKIFQKGEDTMSEA